MCFLLAVHSRMHKRKTLKVAFVMESTTRSWTSYIQYPPHGREHQLAGMWEVFRSYFIFSNLPRTVPCPEVYHCWCLMQNSHFYQQTGHALCLWPQCTQVEADWQSVLFPRGNHEWYEPTGDPHSLPSSGFSVDMTHLLPKRSELESAAVFQRFPFFHGQYWFHMS